MIYAYNIKIDMAFWPKEKYSFFLYVHVEWSFREPKGPQHILSLPTHQTLYVEITDINVVV